MEHSEKKANTPAMREPMKIGSSSSPAEKRAEAAGESISRNDMVPPSSEVSNGMIHPGTKEGNMIAPPGVKERIAARKGGGDQLPAHLKRNATGKTGELEDVRIHTDSTAGELAKELNAEAFTVGKDIFFGQGKYDNYTRYGKELIGHELAHVTDGSEHDDNIIYRKVYETAEFTADAKLLKVYNDVKQTQAYKSSVNGYEGENSIMHLRFHEVPDLGGPNAKTRELDANTITIDFDSKYAKSGSEIALARTMLHELQHARLDMQVKKAGSDGLSKKEFPGIHDYYTRYNDKPGMDSWQHQLMAQHQRKEIIAGLKEVDQLSGNTGTRAGNINVNYPEGTITNVTYTEEEFYDAMSWGGLMTKTKTVDGKKVVEKNVSWENFKKKDPKKAALYLAIIRFEQTIGGALNDVIIEG